MQHLHKRHCILPDSCQWRMQSGSTLLNDGFVLKHHASTRQPSLAIKKVSTSGLVDLERLVALQSASLFSQALCRCLKSGTGLSLAVALPLGSNLLLHFSACRPLPSLPSGDMLLCRADNTQDCVSANACIVQQTPHPIAQACYTIEACSIDIRKNAHRSITTTLAGGAFSVLWPKSVEL